MNSGSLTDNLKQNINKTTVIEISLESFIFRCLQDSFHASKASLIVGVLLDHLNEIDMSLHLVDGFRDEVHHVAED